MQQISEIRRFVKKIPGMQAAVKSLHQFIAFAEKLVKTTSDPSFVKRWQMERGQWPCHVQSRLVLLDPPLCAYR